MIKKILISLFLIIISFFSFASIGFTEEDGEAKKRCAKNGDSMINCPQFTIKTENFSPGGGETLRQAKTGGGKTEETTNILLGVIIKNLIVVFGVLSLFVMTIGGGYMIFHAGEESLLTRGKTMLKYGIISLIIALSAGVIVRVVTWVLY